MDSHIILDALCNRATAAAAVLSAKFIQGNQPEGLPQCTQFQYVVLAALL